MSFIISIWLMLVAIGVAPDKPYTNGDGIHKPGTEGTTAVPGDIVDIERRGDEGVFRFGSS